jgi:hypothetical protein
MHSKHFVLNSMGCIKNGFWKHEEVRDAEANIIECGGGTLYA